MFGDNESVVNSSSIPHAKLHKRHTALSFHSVHEMVASKYGGFYFLHGSDNPADILSKHWSYALNWESLKCLLFCIVGKKIVVLKLITGIMHYLLFYSLGVIIRCFSLFVPSSHKHD